MKVKSEPFKKAERLLRELIEKTPEGERIITIRECIERCQVSKAVIDRVVALLHGEKLLVVRPRSGIYKPLSEEKPQQIINILHFASTEIQTFHSELLYAVNVAMSEMSYQSRVYMMRCENNPDRLIKSIISDNNSILVTICAGAADLKYIDLLKKSGMNVINVLPNMESPLPGSICLDDDLIVKMQIDYLKSLKHEKIAYIHAVTDELYSRSQNKKLDAFCRLALQQQLKVLPHWICYAGWDEKGIVRNLIKMFKQPDSPTALIIQDEQVKGVYSALYKEGMVPGKDISVIGCDDLSWLKYVQPGLTTMRVPRLTTARMLCKKIQRKDFQQIEYIPVSLVKRESVAEPAVEESAVLV